MHIDGCTIVPAKGSHAVKASVFVLELPGPVSSATVRRAINVYESSSLLKELFPRKMEVQSFTVALELKSAGRHSGGLQNNDGELGGVQFQRTAPDGSLELALILQDNLLTYTCNAYSRWQDVFTAATSCLNEFAKLVIEECGVNVVGLQYVDEFIVSGDINNFVASMVFSENARLPASCLSHKGLWHNHSGWFDEPSNDSKVLNNLNVNVAAMPDNRLAVQVVSAHRALLSHLLVDSKEAEHLIPACFDTLHIRNKKLFREILTNDAAASINLEVE